MKKKSILIFLGLILIKTLDAQQPGKIMFQNIYEHISLENLPDNNYVAKTLNMYIGGCSKTDTLKYRYMQFAMSAGTVFHIYFYGLAPEEINNQVTLKLFKMSELASLRMTGLNSSLSSGLKDRKNKYNLPDDVTLKLVAEVNDDVHDNSISFLEYENTKVNEFILELSIKNCNSCSAASVFSFSKK